MAPCMCALAHTHGQERTHACLKYIEVSTTIAVGSMDVDIAVCMDECIVGLCSIERGWLLTPKHFQMVVKGNFTSLPIFK
jgi:hypothetical protein